eukprot:Blabericola_migrator_1__1094@NODE_127_length_13302_cov_126_428410_g112_i0_p1_GENE_NODE_127_length_13302_cov_126_428410_g112_i0NODE_127_length_13302_cov_126_428410_g112_i0_p1_ORF_typecomplete_len1751_score341_21ANAPC4_WD40/PF12894_7/0_033ANAPC4_WD40/PF12894_7/2e03_NODE_127_length_13302_cov_126_428410_g112_i0644011692
MHIEDLLKTTVRGGHPFAPLKRAIRLSALSLEPESVSEADVISVNEVTIDCVSQWVERHTYPHALNQLDSLASWHNLQSTLRSCVNSVPFSVIAQRHDYDWTELQTSVGNVVSVSTTSDLMAAGTSQGKVVILKLHTHKSQTSLQSVILVLKAPYDRIDSVTAVSIQPHTPQTVLLFVGYQSGCVMAVQLTCVSNPTQPTHTQRVTGMSGVVKNLATSILNKKGMDNTTQSSSSDVEEVLWMEQGVSIKKLFVYDQLHTSAIKTFLYTPKTHNYTLTICDETGLLSQSPPIDTLTHPDQTTFKKFSPSRRNGFRSSKSLLTLVSQWTAFYFRGTLISGWSLVSESLNFATTWTALEMLVCGDGDVSTLHRFTHPLWTGKVLYVPVVSQTHTDQASPTNESRETRIQHVCSVQLNEGPELILMSNGRKILVLEYVKTKVHLMAAFSEPDVQIALMEKVNNTTMVLGIKNVATIREEPTQLWLVEIRQGADTSTKTAPLFHSQSVSSSTPSHTPPHNKIIELVFVGQLPLQFPRDQILCIANNSIAYKSETGAVGCVRLNGWQRFLALDTDSQETSHTLTHLVEISCLLMLLDKKRIPSLGFDPLTSRVHPKLHEKWLASIELFYVDALCQYCDSDFYTLLLKNVQGVYEIYIRLACFIEYMMATETADLLPSCFCRLSNRGRLMESLLIRVLEPYLIQNAISGLRKNVKLSPVALAALLKVYGERLGFNSISFSGFQECPVCQVECLPSAVVTQSLRLNGVLLCPGCSLRFLCLCVVFARSSAEAATTLVSDGMIKKLKSSPAGALVIPYLYLETHKETQAIDYLLYESSNMRFHAIKTYLPPGFGGENPAANTLESMSVFPTVNLTFWKDIKILQTFLSPPTESSEDCRPHLSLKLDGVVPTAPLHLMHVLSESARNGDWHKTVDILLKGSDKMAMPPVLRFIVSLSPIIAYQEILIPLFQNREVVGLVDRSEGDQRDRTALKSLYTALCDFVNNFTQDIQWRRQSLMSDETLQVHFPWMSGHSGNNFVDISILHLLSFLLSATVAAEDCGIDLTLQQIESVLQFLLCDISSDYTNVMDISDKVNPQHIGVLQAPHYLVDVTNVEELAHLEKHLGLILVEQSLVCDTALKESLIVSILRRCSERLDACRPACLNPDAPKNYLEIALKRRMFKAAVFMADAQAQVDVALDILLTHDTDTAPISSPSPIASPIVAPLIDASDPEPASAMTSNAPLLSADELQDSSSSSAIQYICHVMSSFLAARTCCSSSSEYLPSRAYSLQEWTSLSAKVLSDFDQILQRLDRPSCARVSFVCEFLEVCNHAMVRSFEALGDHFNPVMDGEIRRDQEQSIYDQFSGLLDQVLSYLFEQRPADGMFVFMSLSRFGRAKSTGLPTIIRSMKRKFIGPFLTVSQNVRTVASTARTLIEEAPNISLKQAREAVEHGSPLLAVAIRLLSQEYREALPLLIEGFKKVLGSVMVQVCDGATYEGVMEEDPSLDPQRAYETMSQFWPFDIPSTDVLFEDFAKVLTSEAFSAPLQPDVYIALCHLTSMVLGPITSFACTFDSCGRDQYLTELFPQLCVALDTLCPIDYSSAKLETLLLYYHDYLIAFMGSMSLSRVQRLEAAEMMIPKLEQLRRSKSRVMKKFSVKLFVAMEQDAYDRQWLIDKLYKTAIKDPPETKRKLVCCLDFSSPKESGQLPCSSSTLRLSEVSCSRCGRNILTPTSLTGIKGKEIALALSETVFDGHQLHHRLCG